MENFEFTVERLREFLREYGTETTVLMLQMNENFNEVSARSMVEALEEEND